MKKVRIILTIAAFALAVAGAVASRASTSMLHSLYGETFEGACIHEAAVQLPSGCNTVSGSTLCTANFPEYGADLPLYSTQWSPGECLNPYTKW